MDGVKGQSTSEPVKEISSVRRTPVITEPPESDAFLHSRFPTFHIPFFLFLLFLIAPSQFVSLVFNERHVRVTLLLPFIGRFGDAAQVTSVARGNIDLFPSRDARPAESACVFFSVVMAHFFFGKMPLLSISHQQTLGDRQSTQMAKVENVFSRGGWGQKGVSVFFFFLKGLHLRE